jgi:hypothetical protein
MTSIVAVGTETGAIPKTPTVPIPEPLTPTPPAFQYFSISVFHTMETAFEDFSGDGKDSTYDLWKYD